MRSPDEDAEPRGRNLRVQDSSAASASALSNGCKCGFGKGVVCIKSINNSEIGTSIPTGKHVVNCASVGSVEAKGGHLDHCSSCIIVDRTSRGPRSNPFFKNTDSQACACNT